MIDFILAGLLYILLMFIAFTFLSFVTIGLVYTMLAGLKRFFGLFQQPGLALNRRGGAFRAACCSTAEISISGRGRGVYCG